MFFFLFLHCSSLKFWVLLLNPQLSSVLLLHLCVYHWFISQDRKIMQGLLLYGIFDDFFWVKIYYFLRNLKFCRIRVSYDRIWTFFSLAQIGELFNFTLIFSSFGRGLSIFLRFIDPLNQWLLLKLFFIVSISFHDILFWLKL